MKKLILLFVFIGCATAMFSQSYNRGIGARAGFGIGVTYKHFINERGALEAFAMFRPIVGYSYTNLGVLYLHHFPIGAVEGLHWYVGGGLISEFYGGKYADLYPNDNKLSFGICAAGGAEYKFANIPLAVSVDIMPGVLFGNNYRSGFRSDVGGLAARYTF
ncbi:MAG: hypothetical protein IPJ06_07640 [Saprospiraceae bacterium]|nr:hypothetical protein [Saprospiraceae bacterium]